MRITIRNLGGHSRFLRQPITHLPMSDRRKIQSPVEKLGKRLFLNHALFIMAKFFRQQLFLKLRSHVPVHAVPESETGGEKSSNCMASPPQCIYSRINCAFRWLFSNIATKMQRNNGSVVEKQAFPPFQVTNLNFAIVTLVENSRKRWLVKTKGQNPA